MEAHLVELRTRAINSSTVLAVVFIVCYYFANDIYTLVSVPIIRHLPANTSIITTQVTAPFILPLQLSFICALLICAPYMLYQTWMFIKPGLYKNEQKNILPVIIVSSALFYLGFVFALLIISPVALKFFANSAPQGVQVMLDLASFLDFITTISFAGGIAFQIPIITSLLIRCGICTKQQLQAKRKHVIVLALVLGMLLAPPDVMSQVLLAVPMWGLFELGLVFSGISKATFGKHQILILIKLKFNKII